MPPEVLSSASRRLPGVSPLRPIVRRALSQDVLKSLRRAIIEGSIPSGQPLREIQSANELGVSRVPVREALRALEREGLVVFDPTGKATVRNFTAEDFKEVLTLRLLLEPSAARFAAQRIQPSDVKAMEQNIQRMQGSTCLLDVTLLDVEFHDLIMQTARHQLFNQCWANMHSQLQVWMARLHQRQGRLKDVCEASASDHQDLVKVLNSGKGDKAAELMNRHLVSWRERLPKSMWEGDVA